MLGCEKPKDRILRHRTMLERIRRNARSQYGPAIGLAAAAAVVACFLPAFEIAVEAIIGAGVEQRSFRYTRELTLAGDLRPFGLLPLAAATRARRVRGRRGSSAGHPAVARGRRPSCSRAALADARLRHRGQATRLDRATRASIGYEEPNGGPLLQPALDDLQDDGARARRRRRSRAGSSGASTGTPPAGSTAGQLFTWSALALGWLTGVPAGAAATEAVGVGRCSSSA